MRNYEREYRVAAGMLRFKLAYDDDTIVIIDDFDIINFSNIKEGYDSADSKEISVYPSNFEITIDDFSGDNYKKFNFLYKQYKVTYPFNFSNTLSVTLFLNDNIFFDGVLDELESNQNKKTLTLKFVDGINHYKNVQIGNPYVLNKLYQLGIISRSSSDRPNSYAYGFTGLRRAVANEVNGYIVHGIEGGDKDPNLQTVITNFVKLFRPNLEVDFSNKYLYANHLTGYPLVTIDRLNIKRICSNIIGRYVVLDKHVTGVNPVIINGIQPFNLNYNKAEYFKVVYEDDDYITYFHDWSGNFPENINSKKWEKGVDEKSISEILKTFAKNTFSYFGFKNYNTFFFRHKRFLSDAIPLENIISMKKVMTVDRVDEVIVRDYYSPNYGQDGSNYNNGNKIEFKIPLNAYKTDLSYEYRLNYYNGTTEVPVTHFFDPVTNMKDIPQEVISRAEWEAHRNFRDQYEFQLYGIDYNYDKTYSVNYDNYVGKIRPLTLDIDLMNNLTTMSALEVD